jgi:hypothetical protein
MGRKTIKNISHFTENKDALYLNYLFNYSDVVCVHTCYNKV